MVWSSRTGRNSRGHPRQAVSRADMTEPSVRMCLAATSAEGFATHDRIPPVCRPESTPVTGDLGRRREPRLVAIPRADVVQQIGIEFDRVAVNPFALARENHV